MRKDFARLAADIRRTVYDGVEFPAMGEMQDTYLARTAAGDAARQRAIYIAQHIPAAGGAEFLKLCGVRQHA